MLPENINPKRLLLILGVFVLLIVAGFFFIIRPESTFTMTPDRALEDILSEKGKISTELARQAILKKDPAFVFIDIRNPYEFQKGHVTGAYNINLMELLSKSTLKKLHNWQRDSIRIVLYANNESEAHGAVQLLRQSGLRMVFGLEGGYATLAPGYPSSGSAMTKQAEDPWYDYSSFLKKDSAAGKGPAAGPSAPKTVKPVRPATSEGKPEGC